MVKGLWGKEYAGERTVYKCPPTSPFSKTFVFKENK